MTTTEVMTIDTMENVQTGEASREAVLREQLRRALAGQSRLEELLKHGRTHLVELRKQVEHAVAERDRATRELAELQAEHQRLSDERAEAESSLTAFLEEDVRRLQDKLQAREQEMLLKDSAAEQRVQELRAKVDGLADENAVLKDKEAELERRVAAIAAKTDELGESLANRGVRLSAVEQTVSELEPLARLGRAAREVAKELRSTTKSIDTHADRLLEVTPVASDCREEIEQLRAEAVRAQSLARQFIEDN